MTRFTPLIIFLLIAAALAFGLRTSEQERHVQAPSPLLGNALPALKLKPLQGDAAWQNEMLENKITIVNVFATWCAPCEVELPQLQALKGIDARVQVIGIVWHDTPENLQKWLAQRRSPYDSIWLDSAQHAGVALGIRGVPESFILDTKGIVRYHLAEPIVETERLQTIAPLIESLLHE